MSSFVSAWVGPTLFGSTVLASAATGAIIGGGIAAGSSLISGENIGDSLQAGLGGAVVGGIGGAIGGGISSAMGGGAGGSTSAGYTLTGDSIADMAVLTDMGYSPGAAEALINTGGAGSYAAGIGTGAMAADYAGTSALNYEKGNLSSSSPQTGNLLSTGLQTAGGLLQQQAASDAAATQAQAQIRAAQIAADAAKFRPVGVTTRFGASQFGKDAQGNLTSAGYFLSPEMKAQQNKLMGVSENMLSQYQGAQAATAPMGAASQRMMTLGQGYLGTSPQEQATKYMAEQQALLATGRERELSSLENRLMQQGRLGLATGGTSTGMMAANPELEAWYNAKRQQDLALAAQATQGGMDYAKFGAGMVGQGGDMLKSMYGTQQAAYAPYQTALGGAGYIEGLGQQAMDTGINIGAKGTAATAQSGMLLGQGMTNAAATQYKADATSPWGALLSGAGSALQPMQQKYAFNPYTGQPL